MVRIESVESHSHAAKVGIRAGDMLYSVNGHDIHDVLDYRFYIMDKRLVLSVGRGTDTLEFVIDKSEYSDIGLDFSTYLMDEKRRCRNNCIFCFIDQNPPGMRETIYFKDDDERLSFLQGNYITLTNLSEADIERIIAMRISPINISVHTTDPELRVKMMRNRFAGNCLRYIKMLDDAGIAINAQLVLCRGINDGEALKKSLTDLSMLRNVESIALVPSGLTKWREGLYPLVPFDAPAAAAVIDIADIFGGMLLEARGRRLIYPSDEFFLLAGRALPSADYYEEYPQIENGVGMIRSDSDEFDECLENLPECDYNRRVSIATGEAAYAFISEAASKAMRRYKNLDVRVYAIKNNFFGGNVTVSGLITGGDIMEQLAGKELGSELLISENMLRAEGDLFLDGTTPQQVSERLGVKLTVCERGGYPLCEAITALKG